MDYVDRDAARAAAEKSHAAQVVKAERTVRRLLRRVQALADCAAAPDGESGWRVRVVIDDGEVKGFHAARRFPAGQWVKFC